MKQYTPYSHFFTDLASLALASGTDGFGPVNGSLTTKYRVTSKVKAVNAASVKLYAICDGRMLIQPQTGDDSKINIIIKPSTNNYSPLKIKYFIYRGVNKADYFTNNVLNQPDLNKPDTLNKMWTTLLALNGIASPAGNIFPLDYVYDFAAAETKLIDNAFQKSLVSCKEGDYIGNFNGEIGLDIVLDQGEYTLENQEVLFNFDLKYARAKEFIFDTDTISDVIKKKRFRENIHHFIDAAAFWGSHIKCGVIQYKNGAKITTISEISNILKKYQTGNKVYIYLNENNRSFNYYDSSRKIYGFDINNIGEDYKTNDWPILIKEISSDKDLLIEYKIDYNSGISDNNIAESERQISIELISGKGSYILKRDGGTNILISKGRYMTYDLKTEISATFSVKTGQTLPSGLQLVDTEANPGKIMGAPQKIGVYHVTIVISHIDGVVEEKTLTFYIDTIDVSLKTNIDANKACADFIFINCNLRQEFPVQNYYDNLWVANLKSSAEYATSNIMYSITYDKNRNVNLYDTIGESAIISNKTIFDKGKKKIGTSSVTKDRRLFAAYIKRSTGANYDSDTFNIDKISSVYTAGFGDKNDYFSTLFNDTNFSIYRGEFTEAGKTIKSLSLFNEISIIRKSSYMLLGITNDEYNTLLIPTGADNVFFHLEEVNSNNKLVRKFRLGLKYEAADGNISSTISYPATDIFIFTLDDLFFFSQEFSDYQEFYKEFSQVKVDFRTVPINSSGFSTYDGKFGFDWLRNGDNCYKNGATMQLGVDFYKGITNGYERPKTLTGKSEYGSKDRAYTFLTRQYPSITTVSSNKDTGIYSVPYLSLFSEEFNNKFVNKPDSDGYTPPSPPTEALLRILIRNSGKTGTIKFVCENDIVKFDKETITSFPDNTMKDTSLVLKIICKKDTAEPVNIKALYFPTGKDINDNRNGLLAGLIVLNKNDSNARNEIKTVFVNCKTDITSDNTGEFKAFTNSEKERLFQIFHQALILPKIDILELPLNTPASKHDKFRINTPDTFVYVTTTPPPLKVLDMAEYPKEFTFLANEIPYRYFKWLKLYSFQLYGRSKIDSTAAAGVAGGIGMKQAILYTMHNNTTIPHEGLHSLSLYHTHQDKENSGTLLSITDPDQKFVFIHSDIAIDETESTDNVMSYSSIRNNIWNWQTKILQKFFKNENK